VHHIIETFGIENALGPLEQSLSVSSLDLLADLGWESAETD
jgi:hypothetical protein